MFNKIVKSKYFIYAASVGLSGTLYFLSFPPANLYYLAWVALVPLILLINGRSMRFSFAAAFLAGLVANSGIFYWLYKMLLFNTGSVLQSAAATLALTVYLSLYFGVWAMLISYTKLNLSVFRFSVFASCLWVALEYMRSYFLTGFPWALLGLSQAQCLPVCQISEFTGAYGVSFIIVFFSAGTAHFIKTTKKFIPYLLLVSALLIFFLFGKILQINSALEGNPYVTVGVVQGNIDQYKKWDANYENEIKTVYAGLTAELSRSNPDIIIWPETAVPGYLPVNMYLYEWVRGVVKQTKTYNLIGTPYNNGDKDYFNAAVLFGPEGEILGVHKKTHLVPFGEYVPFRKALMPYFGILNTLGDFNRGVQFNVFPVKSILWAGTICSENFFGDTVRRFVLNGAEVIVNQTNDAWFFKSAAAEQHFMMNVFRAIENRRPVVVSGNTGVSGVVNPEGRVLKRTELFERTAFISKISPARRLTFYTLFGDIFAQICILVVLIMILAARHILIAKPPKAPEV